MGKWRCPTGKIMYRDLAEASAGKAAIDRRGKRVMGIYKCKLCRRWHLTTESVTNITTS